VVPNAFTQTVASKVRLAEGARLGPVLALRKVDPAIEYDHMAFAQKAFPLHAVGQFAGTDWGADVKVDKVLVGLNFQL
jgi:hypothetical protein